jgi:hypothetical protein
MAGPGRQRSRGGVSGNEVAETIALDLYLGEVLPGVFDGGLDCEQIEAGLAGGRIPIMFAGV